MCKPLAAPDSPWQVFLIFLRLGLTSFGGPLAHLGYFRQALVVERRWLDEARYAELVALCQTIQQTQRQEIDQMKAILARR